ncbi:hypothetical protein OG851_43370 (plasmid) [Streptomyces sp. NBC_00161]|uniref:hypothetical protein n=1 Tax=Streptomyces sp. NBC_00161 TaxID=2975671 RepID=UPI002F907757
MFSSSARLKPGDAFTNRHRQWEAACTVLTEHLVHVSAPGFDPQDLETRRTNLLVI